MKELNPEVNIDYEIDAIVDFVGLKWTPIDNLKEIVTAIKDKATHDARALFDTYDVFEYAHPLIEARRNKLEQVSNSKSAYLYDHTCHLLNEIIIHSSKVRDGALNIDGNWYFENKTKPIVKGLIKQYPELSKIKPNGWNAFIKNYSDFDGQEEYDPEEDRNLFRGVNTESACAADLPGRLALPYVAYDDRCQGRKPSEVLIGSIYAQFIRIMEYKNSLGVCNALEALGLPNTDSLVFELNIKTDNPLLKVIMALASEPYTEDDYLESLAETAKFEALPEEERRRIKAERAEEISQMLSDMLKTDVSSKPDLEELNQNNKVKELLIQEFGV